jgi:hypothetical protein
MGRVRSALLILVLLPPLIFAKDRIRDTTICELNSHESAFAGKMVRVRGRVDRGVEWFGIEANKCAVNVEYPTEPSDAARVADSNVYLGPKVPANLKLLRDENFARFTKLTDEQLPQGPRCTCFECFRYEVTVTMTGLFQIAKSGKPGFGHMNMARSRLVLQSVADVEATDRWAGHKDSDCALPRDPYPGWNQPLSVPPFPGARPNPK